MTDITLSEVEAEVLKQVINRMMGETLSKANYLALCRDQQQLAVVNRRYEEYCLLYERLFEESPLASRESVQDAFMRLDGTEFRKMYERGYRDGHAAASVPPVLLELVRDIYNALTDDVSPAFCDPFLGDTEKSLFARMEQVLEEGESSDVMRLLGNLWAVYEAADDVYRWFENNEYDGVPEAKLLRRELDTLERVVEGIKSTRPEPEGPACVPSQVGGGPEMVG